MSLYPLCTMETTVVISSCYTSSFQPFTLEHYHGGVLTQCPKKMLCLLLKILGEQGKSWE